MKNKTLIFSLIAVFVLVLLAGCSSEKVSERITSFIEGISGPIEIEEITVCKNVDTDYSPIDPTDIFPSGTEIVYLSVKINNMTREDKLTVKWNYLESGEEISTTDFQTETPGSGYVGFSLAIEGAFPSGRYNAAVYLNNQAQQTVEFSVE
ncbi:MAG: hypothetical protein PHQ09_05000 [Actinomycetota bacterium]|nr:hypothetical protein [Actinomycetota bacterium]